METFRLIVAGSRSWDNRDAALEAIIRFYGKYIDTGTRLVIISGTARGADRIGENIANSNKSIDLERFPADWERHGKSAGYKRNIEMAEAANGCLVLWDGQSRGSKHMINIAKEHGLPTSVVTIGNLYEDSP